jgi:hypothetical protein
MLQVISSPRAFQAGHGVKSDRYKNTRMPGRTCSGCQNYLGNPFIEKGDIIPILNTVLKSAALLVNVSVPVYNYKEYPQFDK